MKKFLLVAAAAVVSLTVSAQKVAPVANFAQATSTFKLADKTMFKGKQEKRTIAPNQQFKDYSAVREAIANGTAVKSNKMFHAVSQADLYGDYVEDDDNLDFLETCMPVLSAYDFEGKTYVLMENIAASYGTVVAEYDEATSTLDASGAQVCYEDATYGEMLLLSIHEDDDKNIYSDVTFTVGEDGSISLDQYGWYIYMNEGEYEGECWTLGYNTVLNKVNGSTYATLSSNSWNDEMEIPAYVEMVDDMITIHNVDEKGGGVITVFVNEDGTTECPNLQPIASGSETTGDFFWYTVYVDEEGYLNQDEDEANATPGFLRTNGQGEYFLYFGTQTEEQAKEGKYAAAYNVILSTEGYWFGHWCYGYQFNWVNNTTGIANVNANESASNRFFNLAGQQVSKNSKGIVIANGKKYLNK